MAKKVLARNWGFNWFNDTFANILKAVSLLKKSGVGWHPCATRYFVPKYNAWITKEEWDTIPA